MQTLIESKTIGFWPATGADWPVEVLLRRAPNGRYSVTRTCQVLSPVYQSFYHLVEARAAYERYGPAVRVEVANP